MKADLAIFGVLPLNGFIIDILNRNIEYRNEWIYSSRADYYLTEVLCYVIFELLSLEAVLTPGFVLKGGGFMKNIWIKLILILTLIWAVTMVIVITIKNT